MQLDSGDYIIRAGSDEHIRVSFAGNTGNAAADLGTDGAHANLAIGDTPHNNFQATAEVPATSDLTVHLTAGNVGIAIPNANDYGMVDAAVKVGNLSGGPFGDSGSGLSPQLKWSGPGKCAPVWAPATWN